MDTLHLNTYLRLVEALLKCAKGEEWLLLQQHQQLIDADLIGVMAQITEQLNSEGNLPAAKFLHYWTAQLTHLLQQNSHTDPATENQSPSYLQLIQTILECEKGDEVAILSQHPDPIDKGLVQAMNQVAAQLELLVNISSRLEQLETSIGKHQNPLNPLCFPDLNI